MILERESQSAPPASRDADEDEELAKKLQIEFLVELENQRERDRVDEALCQELARKFAAENEQILFEKEQQCLADRLLAQKIRESDVPTYASVTKASQVRASSTCPINIVYNTPAITSEPEVLCSFVLPNFRENLTSWSPTELDLVKELTVLVSNTTPEEIRSFAFNFRGPIPDRERLHKLACRTFIHRNNPQLRAFFLEFSRVEYFLNALELDRNAPVTCLKIDFHGLLADEVKSRLIPFLLLILSYKIFRCEIVVGVGNNSTDKQVIQGSKGNKLRIVVKQMLTHIQERTERAGKLVNSFSYKTSGSFLVKLHQVNPCR